MSGDERKRCEAMVVDTGVLVDVIRGESRAADYILGVQGSIRVSRLTVMELIKGAKSMVELNKLMRQLKALGPVEVVEVDGEISVVAGEIFSQYWFSQSLGIIDSFIGATAMVRGEELVTKNSRHFRGIPRLDLIVPY
ncbi:MAG TPA: type II toxin-antitoxin system VapC family toxin [Patescibacteria group bacterium]|nr:type II toxin-antitoxin system VapC family toxin [Patescibacteria group bacterium]